MLFLTWGIASMVFILLAMISFTVTTEDAYISYRYADNIVNGLGLVFNAGEERVEGFSNPSWVALLAILGKLGMPVVNAGRCLGLLFGVLTIFEILVLFRLVNRENPVPGIFAAAAFITAPVILFWSQTGLENGLFVYLIVLGMRLAIQEELDSTRFPYSSIAYFLLAVTRPEGIMYFGIIGAWKFVKNIKKGKYIQNKERLGIWVAITILPFILFLLLRYSIFHAFVPNTFFAKVNDGIRANLRSGSFYLLGFLLHYYFLPLVIPLVTFFMVDQKLVAVTARRLLLALLLQSVVLVLFILYAGGDIHPYDRFGVPLVVFSLLATFCLLSSVDWIQNPSWRKISWWIATIFVISNFTYWFAPAHNIEPEISRPPNFLTANLAGLVSGRKSVSEIIERFTNPPNDALEFVGRDLHDNPGINGLLAAEQCGKIPYYYGKPVLDLLGLNDPEIASIVHDVSTWDLYAKEVLGHHPENFVMVYRNGHLISRYYIENTILSMPFQNRYKLDAIYHTDYFFTGLTGQEYTFNLELVRYVRSSEYFREPLSLDELSWLDEWKGTDISRENPELYASGVEKFRAAYAGDDERIIHHEVHLN